MDHLVLFSHMSHVEKGTSKVDGKGPLTWREKGQQSRKNWSKSRKRHIFTLQSTKHTVKYLLLTVSRQFRNFTSSSWTFERKNGSFSRKPPLSATILSKSWYDKWHWTHIFVKSYNSDKFRSQRINFWDERRQIWLELKNK